MSPSDINRFSAAGQALGYLAQVEYALLLVLQRMDSEPILRLSLETVDDITFEGDGTPRELWQTKHHINRRGSLSNSSPDLWKTLHNWIETSDQHSACFLLSTSAAPDGAASKLLGPHPGTRDVGAAQEILDAAASTAGNGALAKYHEKYLDLGHDERAELLARVVVLDDAASADHITERLIASVRKSVVAERRLALVERLRGWWHGRAMVHLTRVAQGEVDWIAIQEVEDQLLRVAQSLRDENLPLDYGDEPEPTLEEVKRDDRVFVEQLNRIMLHHERIRQAVIDHNRAFLQRSRWERDQLLRAGELERYDRRLIEEWKRVFLPLAEPAADEPPDEAKKCSAAQERYAKLQERPMPEIRREVTSGYIPFGSLHILADRLQIGWHPDWVDLLKHRLEEARAVDGEVGAA